MNLAEAQQYLTELGARATTDREDAAAVAQLAREDMARFERFTESMAALNFPADVVNAVGQMRGRAQLRLHAAEARAREAEATIADVARLQEQLLPHFRIRERGQQAGGLADREAYGDRPSRAENVGAIIRGKGNVTVSNSAIGKGARVHN